MTSDIVARTAEYRDIHLAVCRARRQGLCCSTCTTLTERAERAIRHSWAPCLRCDDADYLIGGLCEPCRVVEAA